MDLINIYLFKNVLYENVSLLLPKCSPVYPQWVYKCFGTLSARLNSSVSCFRRMNVTGFSNDLSGGERGTCGAGPAVGTYYVLFANFARDRLVAAGRGGALVEWTDGNEMAVWRGLGKINALLFFFFFRSQAENRLDETRSKKL